MRRRRGAIRLARTLPPIASALPIRTFEIPKTSKFLKVAIVPSREERRHDRKAFDYVAAIDFGDASESVACEIVDISDGGAKLRPMLCAPEALPDHFTLCLSATGKVRRSCAVAWRSATELGVRFIKNKSV